MSKKAISQKLGCKSNKCFDSLF